MRIIGMETKAMRRKTTGWFFTATGFIACPCHLIVTLPLAVAVLSGTALGGWIATHEGAIALGMTLYFVGALVLGTTLLSFSTRQTRPTRQAAQQTCDSACDRDSTSGIGSTQTTTAEGTSAPAVEVR